MVRSDVPRRGDVYWIDPNPVAGREMKDRHRFVVITPREINALGVSMTVPITTGGVFARNVGLAVAVSGHDTTGVAVCNQVRSFVTPKLECPLCAKLECLLFNGLAVSRGRCAKVFWG